MYSELSGGAARVTITPAVPTVQAYVAGTVNQNAGATLRFRAAYLVNDTTLPWLKVIAPGGDCAAALGSSDAEGGGSGRVHFVSVTEAEFPWRNVGLSPGAFAFCYGATEIGVYAELDTPPGEARTGLVVVGPIEGQPTVSALLSGSAAPIVAGAAVLFSVATENVADNNTTRPWVKVIAPGAQCGAHTGAVDSVGGGTAISQLVYVSSTLCEWTWSPVAASPAADYVLCWGSTERGAFYPLTGGAATLDVIGDTGAPTAAPTNGPTRAPTADSTVALTVRVCGASDSSAIVAAAVASALASALGDAPANAVAATHVGASGACFNVRAVVRGWTAATADAGGLLAAINSTFDAMSLNASFAGHLVSRFAAATSALVIAPHAVVHPLTWSPSVSPTLRPTGAPSTAPSHASTGSPTATMSPTAARNTTEAPAPGPVPPPPLAQKEASLLGPDSTLTAQEESVVMLALGAGAMSCYCALCCLLPALALCSLVAKREKSKANDASKCSKTSTASATVSATGADGAEGDVVGGAMHDNPLINGDAAKAARRATEEEKAEGSGDEDEEESGDDLAALIQLLGGDKHSKETTAAIAKLAGGESVLLQKLTGGHFGSGKTRERVIAKLAKAGREVKRRRSSRRRSRRSDRTTSSSSSRSESERGSSAEEDEGGEERGGIELRKLRSRGGGRDGRGKTRRRSGDGDRRRRSSGGVGGGGGGGGGRRRRKSNPERHGAVRDGRRAREPRVRRNTVASMSVDGHAQQLWGGQGAQQHAWSAQQQQMQLGLQHPRAPQWGGGAAPQHAPFAVPAPINTRWSPPHTPHTIPAPINTQWSPPHTPHTPIHGIDLGVIMSPLAPASERQRRASLTIVPAQL